MRRGIEGGGGVERLLTMVERERDVVMKDFLSVRKTKMVANLHIREMLGRIQSE